MAVNINDFSIVFAKRGFAAFEASVMETAAQLESAGRVQAAGRLRSAYQDYLRELEDVGARIASLAHSEIVGVEQQTRVRPDTGGGGGPRLEDYVGRSEPLDDLPGSVAVNDERALEDNGVDWWWTNEEGYSGHIGRTIYGVFMDAGFTSPSRPLPGMRGVHPLFQAGKGGKGTIQEPIPARRFVERGGKAAEAQWHAQIAAARSHFISRIGPLLRPTP